jgi:hypothetical protein
MLYGSIEQNKLYYTILISAGSVDEWSASCHGCFTLGEEELVPIEQKDGRAKQPIWMFWSREKSFSLYDTNLVFLYRYFGRGCMWYLDKCGINFSVSSSSCINHTSEQHEQK